MVRAARLLDLIQALRRRRRAVPAALLAEELGVSLRTVYRDIATLVAQGAPIEGEPGFGYILRPGFLLPPLMLGEDEVDAVILGLRMVARRGDATLEWAADDALTKILAVLPPEMEDADLSSSLLAGEGLRPWRRNVRWHPTGDVPVTSVLDKLRFVDGRSNWAYTLRFGLVAIPPEDFAVILDVMRGVDDARH